MIATSLLSLVLLALAGVLFDAHRRDWRRADQPDEDPAAHRFARSRFHRRRLATGVIAVLGVLVAIWPIVPREPTSVLVYLVALCGLTLALIAFAATDAWASGKYYQGESRRRLAEHATQLREAIDQRRLAGEVAGDSEAGRV
ncbi:hypothetical protein MalM25_02110 [Planctomycetes bacterium MalM25]|nr:hypothetical protein MalM25_02110 [Planctomycetes bacterium MalM25]